MRERERRKRKSFASQELGFGRGLGGYVSLSLTEGNKDLENTQALGGMSIPTFSLSEKKSDYERIIFIDHRSGF